MIRIEFPADSPTAARVFAEAMTRYADELADRPCESCSTPQEPDQPDQEPVSDQEPVAELPVSQPEPAASSRRVDDKGVTFDVDYCGNAKIPFYGSGKKKGQWKKSKGLEESVYDDWYAAELANTTNLPAEYPVSDVFDIPQDAGTLMKWVSEQQAAGLLTPHDVTDAYTALQLSLDAILNPDLPVAENCKAIFNHLSQKVS